jgi:hypothetical protein
MTFLQFLADHHSQPRTLRLGQRFVNRYIRASWPTLYYEEDDGVSEAYIRQYLEQHHYGADMPRESNV